MAEEVDLSESCQISGIRFMKDLIQLKPWTIMMLDSLGRPSAGSLKGPSWIPGDYDQCLKIDSNAENTITGKRSYDIRGKFCYINVNVNKINSEMIEKIMTLKNQTLVKFIEFICKPFTVSHMISTLKLAARLFIDVCIPNSCSEKDLQNIIKWVTGNGDLLTVGGCQKRDDKRIYSAPQIITMTVFAFFIIWVILATVAEKLRKLTNHPAFKNEAKILNNFLSVSLNTSLQKLMNVNINRETKWICAAKFFIMNIFVFFHTTLVFGYVPSV
ncbi:uncharacterized protein, partial [Centruroides vittatus]|uniref:uncharacterized protein n=2 Tax=Centruroides vittatus TaxID=120091 RepID=UPI00350F57F9